MPVDRSHHTTSAEEEVDYGGDDEDDENEDTNAVITESGPARAILIPTKPKQRKEQQKHAASAVLPWTKKTIRLAYDNTCRSAQATTAATKAVSTGGGGICSSSMDKNTIRQAKGNTQRSTDGTATTI